MSDTPASTFFDDFGAVFEASVNWPKRLAYEEPFYRDLFARLGVASVLDAACGPGHHAAMFHRWGLRVQGADLSTAMIARARSQFPADVTLAWRQRGYTQPAQETFDAVICVGNSLALAADEAMAAQAIAQMIATAGRVLVIHLANMASWPDGPCLWQKCLRATLPEGPATCIKGVHRSGNRPFIELLVIADGDPPKLRHQSTAMLLLEAAWLEAQARHAGSSRVQILGGYRNEPYARASSVDLLLVAER